MRMITLTIKTPGGEEIELEFDTDKKLVRGIRGVATLIEQCGGLKQAIEFSMKNADEAMVKAGWWK